MSAYYYTTLCAFCEHPIKKGAETKGVFTEWSHSDKNVCRANIRDDTRNEVRETVLERREQFMQVTHTPPAHLRRVPRPAGGDAR
jgi:hypothetical protein